MYGWHGRLLRVDLTNGTFREETIPEDDARRLIGGRGLAIKYLFEGMDPRADPLSPDNLLIMATGPLTSTPAPTGNRYMVVLQVTADRRPDPLQLGRHLPHHAQTVRLRPGHL